MAVGLRDSTGARVGVEVTAGRPGVNPAGRIRYDLRSALRARSGWLGDGGAIGIATDGSKSCCLIQPLLTYIRAAALVAGHLESARERIGGPGVEKIAREWAMPASTERGKF